MAERSTVGQPAATQARATERAAAPAVGRSASPHGAGSAYLQAAQAQAARVVQRMLSDTGGPMVQLDRAKNPRRGDSAGYQPDPADAGKEPHHKLTEHHIVPHATLDAAQKKLKADLDRSQFLPAPGEVTVQMMTNLEGGWKPEWVTDYNRAHADAPLALGGSANDQKGLLFTWLKEQNPGDHAIVRAEKFDFMAALSPGDDMDEDFAIAFLEWFPGNIVRGPTNRKHDQGDGNALDKELVHLLRTGHGDEAHAAAAEALMVACVNVIKTPGDPVLRQAAVKAFADLNAFGYTDYVSTDWVVFGAAPDAVTPTPLATDAQMSVPGYLGN